jgi:outer membrane protein assembly factor BamE
MKRFPIFAALLLSACSSLPDVTSHLTPYRIDVRQGNMVTQEMVAQLKPGQTRQQVSFILGTPLVTDMFHADRWDYVYRFQPGRGEVQERHLIVFFDGNKLARLGGDVVANAPANAKAENEARIIDIPGATDAKAAAPAAEPAPAKPDGAL